MFVLKLCGIQNIFVYQMAFITTFITGFPTIPVTFLNFKKLFVPEKSFKRWISVKLIQIWFSMANSFDTHLRLKIPPTQKDFLILKEVLILLVL